MKEITWTLTVEEANLVLEGVGTLPFARVYELVAKLQLQASEQVRAAAAAPAAAEDPGGGRPA